MGAASIKSRSTPDAPTPPDVHLQGTTVPLETIGAVRFPVFIASRAPSGFHGVTAPVPKILWQVGPFPYDAMPAPMANAMATWATHAPGYTRVYATNDDADAFMASPAVEAALPGMNAAYASLVPAAYRADLWRLTVVLLYGGVYADMSVWLSRPLDVLVHPDLPDSFVMPIDIAHHGVPGLWQGFFASVAEHPLLRAIAEFVVARVAARTYGMMPLDVSGPQAVARAAREFTGTPFARDWLFTPGRYALTRATDGTPFPVHFFPMELLAGRVAMRGQGAAAGLHARWPGYYSSMYTKDRPPRYTTFWHSHTVYK
jgi:hypothetical protein